VSDATVFDRVSSFQIGFDGSPMDCTPYVDGSPPVLQLPFTAGPSRSSTVFRTIWSVLVPESTVRPWQALKPVVASDAPECGARSATGYVLLYCARRPREVRCRRRDAAVRRAGWGFCGRGAHRNPVRVGGDGPRRDRRRHPGRVLAGRLLCGELGGQRVAAEPSHQWIHPLAR
jgi:hypothetical protein